MRLWKAQSFKAKVALTAVLVGFITGVLLPASETLAGTLSDSGDIQISGTVASPPPSSGAVITSPTEGSRFTRAHITVMGSCPATTIVEIYKNDIFAGSTTCDGGGQFSLEIDLVAGQNRLKARVHDALNQYGPDSPTVTVYYDAPSSVTSPGGSATPIATPQMVLITESLYQGQSKSRPLKIDIEIAGGQAPFAVVIDWGDDQQDIFSRTDGKRFTVEHTYQSPGTYKIVIKGTDSLGGTAYLQVVGIVNGPIYQDPTASTTDKNRLEFFVNKVLPLIIFSLILMLTFWLGERWEFHEITDELKNKKKLQI